MNHQAQVARALRVAASGGGTPLLPRLPFPLPAAGLPLPLPARGSLSLCRPLGSLPLCLPVAPFPSLLSMCTNMPGQ